MYVSVNTKVRQYDLCIQFDEFKGDVLNEKTSIRGK